MNPKEVDTKPVEADVYATLSGDTLEALNNYLERGTYPGDTLGAVLTNDLKGVFARGDESFLSGLRVLMMFMHNRVPAMAWGSEERVTTWLRLNYAARASYLNGSSYRAYYARRRAAFTEWLNNAAPAYGEGQ